MFELYNLREDIGETRNLAGQFPEKVKELDSLIDQFVKDTAALYPKPNPAYRPTATPVAGAAGSTEGLVPRNCKLFKSDGAILVVGDGRLPFLGTARVKLRGPLKLTLLVRSQSGGNGRVHWKTVGQEDFPATGQSVDYEVRGGDSWQEITVDLPIEGRPQIVRLYLPAENSSVELRIIRFQDAQGRETSWDFSDATP